MQYDDTWGNALQDERIYINQGDTTRIVTINPDYSQLLDNEIHTQQMLAQEFIDIETSSDFFVVTIFTLATLIAVKFVLYYSDT